jgi:hypothetical protein
MTFSLQSTSTTDYFTVEETLPAATGYRGFEAKRATVTLEFMDDDKVWDASVNVYGYDLTAKGKRDMRSGDSMLFGTTDEEARYNLVRDLILDSAKRHGVDVATIDSLFVRQTWAETHQQRVSPLLAKYLTDFGVTPTQEG